MGLGERIRLVRESLKDSKGKKASMAVFANMLGVTSGAVSQWENGQKNPSASMIRLISEKFNVNETWLLTGEGEIHGELSEEAELAQIAAEIYRSDDERKKKLFKMISCLDEKDLTELQRIWGKILDANK